MVEPEAIVARGDRHLARDVALIGGVAVVAWLLWQRKANGADGGDGSGFQGAAAPSLPKPCRVWIRANHIDLDGMPAKLATVVARCRENGRADVHATGDAITRSIIAVLDALVAAGVAIDAPPDIARLIRKTEPSR